jgi:hypothetical protein
MEGRTGHGFHGLLVCGFRDESALRVRALDIIRLAESKRCLLLEEERIVEGAFAWYGSHMEGCFSCRFLGLNFDRVV